MCPMANAIVSTVRPKASATPANPIPKPGKAAASTALPQPPKTSQNVPKNSAIARLVSDIDLPPEKNFIVPQFTLYVWYCNPVNRWGGRSQLTQSVQPSASMVLGAF